MSFDEIFDLTAGVYFNFYNNVKLGRAGIGVCLDYTCLPEPKHVNIVAHTHAEDMM